ncbi:MAG: hypothetical protein ACODAU_12590 [Myxococcota bacterium]
MAERDIWRRMPWPVRPIPRAFMISNEEEAAEPWRRSLEWTDAPDLQPAS